MISFSRQDTIWLIAIAVNVCTLIFGWAAVRNTGFYKIEGITLDAGDVLPLPLRFTKNILMTFEDTDQYQLFGERADAEWAAASPLNDGYVHFGEGHRFFATAVAHEMHCVQVLRMSIVNPAHPKVNYAHSAHCLNYLRVYALCNADLTLEKFDPWMGNFTENSIGQTHVCRNWEDAYHLFAENTKEWLGMGGSLRTPD